MAIVWNGGAPVVSHAADLGTTPMHVVANPTEGEPSRKQSRAIQLDYIRIYTDWKTAYLRARAEAERQHAPQLRVVAMQGTIHLLRETIHIAQRHRAEVRLGAGLRQLDTDLAGLRARYRQLYARWSPEELPPPSEWTPQEWESFVEDLEGPILLWSGEECRARWGIPFGAPPCQGPDLLLAMQIVNGLAEARMMELDLLDPLAAPVGAAFASTAIQLDALLESSAGLAQEAGTALADVARDMGSNIMGYLEAATKPSATKAFVLVGAAVVAAAGVALYLVAKNRRAA